MPESLTTEQKEELLVFCNHIVAYMNMATKEKPSAEEQERMFNLFLDEARPEEVIPLLKGFKMAKKLEQEIMQDRKDKMLSDKLYEKTEDGQRKISEVVDRYLKLFDITMDMIVHIRKIPSKTARAKLSAAVRHASDFKKQS